MLRFTRRPRQPIRQTGPSDLTAQRHLFVVGVTLYSLTMRREVTCSNTTALLTAVEDGEAVDAPVWNAGRNIARLAALAGEGR